jgi:hypothetical protein
MHELEDSSRDDKRPSSKIPKQTIRDDQQHANINFSYYAQADNSLTEFSIKECIKTLSIVSLPHLAIILIFVIYAFLGASILREIEADNNNAMIREQQEKEFKLNELQRQLKKSNELREMLINKKNYDLYLEFKQYHIKLNQMNMKILTKLKKHQESLYTNFESFLNECNKLISQSLNLTEYTAPAGQVTKIKANGKSSKEKQAQEEHNDLETMKFIAQLYRKPKKHLNSANIFRSIAKHLIVFKNELRSDLSVKLKSLAEKYEEKQNELEKNLYSIIDEQEHFYKKNDKFMIYNVDNGEKTSAEMKSNQPGNDQIAISIEDHIENDIRKTKLTNSPNTPKWTLSRSIYFIGTLLTTIGKSFS